MAVASDAPMSALFDEPPAQELGPSKLEVVANGIPSAPLLVTVAANEIFGSGFEP